MIEFFAINYIERMRKELIDELGIEQFNKNQKNEII